MLPTYLTGRQARFSLAGAKLVGAERWGERGTEETHDGEIKMREDNASPPSTSCALAARTGKAHPQAGNSHFLPLALTVSLPAPQVVDYA